MFNNARLFVCMLIFVSLHPGFYSKQHMCIYCAATQWVYASEDPLMSQYLYTNFGPGAAHRNTWIELESAFLFFNFSFSSLFVRVWKLYSWRYVSWVFHPRLVTVQEWHEINPATPLLKIPGWSPWRTLSFSFQMFWQDLFFLTGWFAKNHKLFPSKFQRQF